MTETVLTIDHRPYSRQELLAEADTRIRDTRTPPWERSVFAFIRQWFDDSQVVVQHTSGTTGKSKAIVLDKESMIRSAAGTCRFFGLLPVHTALLCLPVDYIAGKMMLVRCVVGGLNLLLTEPRATPDLSGMNGVDFCAMVPVQVMHAFSGKKIPDIRTLIVGGTGITPDLEKLVQDIQVEVFATYGMTETCSHIAVRRINGPRPESAYACLPGVQISTDPRGCLVIRTDYLPSPVVTNDRVEILDANRFIWIGRTDNLININGIKVVPEEVESALSERTGLTCALVSVPDKKGAPCLFLAVVGKSPADEERILSELSSLLPRRLKRPGIVYLEELPRNPSYKIDRQRLAEKILSGL